MRWAVEDDAAAKDEAGSCAPADPGTSEGAARAVSKSQEVRSSFFRMMPAEVADAGAVPPLSLRDIGGPVCHWVALNTLRQRDPSSEVCNIRAFMSARAGLTSAVFRYVIANDLSPAAIEAMRRNVELNDLHEKEEPAPEGSSESPKIRPAKVRVNEGDAW